MVGCVAEFGGVVRLPAAESVEPLGGRIPHGVLADPAAVGEGNQPLVIRIEGILTNVGIGAVHAQQVQQGGQQVGGVEQLVYFHGLQVGAPDKTGGSFQQQLFRNPGQLQKLRLVFVAVGVVIGNPHDDRVLQLSMGFQLGKHPGEEIIHQPGFQIGTVGFLAAGQASVLRIFFQAPVTEHLVVFVTQMSGTGNDEVQLGPLPEEAFRQLLVVKQQLIVIEAVLVIGADIVLVGYVLLIAHGLGEDAPGIKGGVVIVVNQSGIALLTQKAGQGLVKVVGHIVEGVTALTAEEGAGVDAELGVERPHTAIAGGVEPGEGNALGHQLLQRGGVLPDHPVIHGFHQHQNHVFALQKAGHFIVRRFFPGIKVGVYILSGLFLGLGVARGKGIDVVGVKILHPGLVNAADLIKPVGAEHILIGGLRRLHPSVIGTGVLNAAVAEKDCLGQEKSRGNGCDGAQRRGNPGFPACGNGRKTKKNHNAKCKKYWNADPPAQGIFQQNVQIICALRGVPEVRNPDHFPEQEKVPGLNQGVDQKQKIADAVADPGGFSRQQPEQGGEHDCPEQSKGQGPQGVGAQLSAGPGGQGKNPLSFRSRQKTECQHFNQEERQRQHHPRQLLGEKAVLAQKFSGNRDHCGETPFLYTAGHYNTFGRKCTRISFNFF